MINIRETQTGDVGLNGPGTELPTDGYCCAHFIVKQDRIQLRTRDFYQNALAYLNSTESYQLLPGTNHIWQGDVKARAPCQLMMAMWQIMFGEGPSVPLAFGS